MKKQLVLFFVTLLAVGLYAASPVVTNVIADPQPGQVVITYNLAHADSLPCEVSVEASVDGGANYTIFPTTLSGDIGIIQATPAGADHQIIWDTAQDNVGPGDNYRVKVIADDFTNLIYDGNVLEVPDDVTIYYLGDEYGSSAVIPDNQLVVLIQDSIPYFYHTSLGNAELSEETSKRAIGCYLCGGIMDDDYNPDDSLRYVLDLGTGIRVDVSDAGVDFTNRKKRFAAVDNQIADNPTYLSPRGEIVELNLVGVFHGHPLIEFLGYDTATIPVSGEVKTYGAAIRLQCTTNAFTYFYIRHLNNNAIAIGADPDILAAVNDVDCIYMLVGTIQQITGSVLPTNTLEFIVDTLLDAGFAHFASIITQDDYVSQTAWIDFWDDFVLGLLMQLATDGVEYPTVLGAALDEALDIIGAFAWIIDNNFIALYDILNSDVYSSWTPEMVATPIFNPPGGNYSTAQSVSISCATNGATIRYTIDGSEPTSSSQEYNAPINVTSDITIKAKGFKDGWTTSSTASASYVITSVWITDWSDNFDSYALNQFPPNWTGSGNVTETFVSNYDYVSPPYSLSMAGVSGGNWEACIHRQFDNSHNNYRFDFRYYFTGQGQVGNHNDHGEIFLSTGPSWTSSLRTMLAFKPNGEIWAIYGGTYQIIGTYNLNAWVDMAIEYTRNPTTVTLKYYRDGILIHQGNADSYVYESNLSYFSPMSGDTRCLFDDISVSYR